MVLLLLTTLLAHAGDPGAQVRAASSGTWRLRSDPDAYQAAAEASVEAAVADMNFAFRAIARNKLLELAPPCAEYRFDLDETHFSLTCVGHEPVRAPLDGTGVTYKKKDGEVVPVRLEVDGDVVQLHFTGEDGGQVTTLRFSEGALKVQRRIHSQYLEKSVIYEARYSR